VGQDITELLNTRNWRAGARYRSDWRKKAGYYVARKQVEKPLEEQEEQKVEDEEEERKKKKKN